MTLAAILAAIQAFNATAPALSGLILTFRKPDGTETALVTLDAAEQVADANIAELEDFLARNKAV
jgi:hypothetical protein